MHPDISPEALHFPVPVPSSAFFPHTGMLPLNAPSAAGPSESQNLPYYPSRLSSAASYPPAPSSEYGFSHIQWSLHQSRQQ
jgi:hypothetical protein